MGEFNVLPVVGQNKLPEVYVVGQLHIDLFEKSELPDMALSNRQGYKSDDPRYEAVVSYIRKELLPDILKKRQLWVNLNNAVKKKKETESLKRNETELRQVMDHFIDNASRVAVENIQNVGIDAPQNIIRQAISDSINDNAPDLGIKTIIDSQKKKILISQTFPDKSLADVVYNMLLFNNVNKKDILFTNCDDEECRIPEGESVYNYLKEFFVDSYSKQKPHVLFITSKNTKQSWGAITEIGASWITSIEHKIFNIDTFRPEHPLDDNAQWHTTLRDDDKDELIMTRLSADIFCQKIEDVCNKLGYATKSRDENKRYLETLVIIN